MLEQRVRAGHQKHVGLPVWKRLILIAGMLLPGGALAALVPSQTAHAQVNPFVCRAAPGGNGGLANHGSAGGDGASAGGCVSGPRGGDAASGGQNNSPGGPGGNVYY
jgi:hypothetical protein